MVSFPGIRCSLLRFMLLPVLVILVIPVPCVASTPPVQPSLVMTVPDTPAGGDVSLTLLLTWNGYVSYNKPPDYIIVEAFSLGDGTRLGAFPVSRQNSTCEAENACTYRAFVGTANFPPGEFMLVATDPLSGVAARQPVTITSKGDGSTDFFRRFEQEQVFVAVSGVLAALLLFVLVILVGEGKSR